LEPQKDRQSRHRWYVEMCGLNFFGIPSNFV
jgi:hypothetical protein